MNGTAAINILLEGTLDTNPEAKGLVHSEKKHTGKTCHNDLFALGGHRWRGKEPKWTPLFPKSSKEEERKQGNTRKGKEEDFCLYKLTE